MVLISVPAVFLKWFCAAEHNTGNGQLEDGQCGEDDVGQSEGDIDAAPSRTGQSGIAGQPHAWFWVKCNNDTICEHSCVVQSLGGQVPSQARRS